MEKKVYTLGIAYIGLYARIRTRGFDKKLIKAPPCEILCSACSYMKYWVCLHDVGFKEAILENVGILLKAAYPCPEVPVWSSTSTAEYIDGRMRGWKEQENSRGLTVLCPDQAQMLN